MITIFKNISWVILLTTLFACCKKESDILVKTPKKLSPFEIKGFVLGEPLEQYFDGVKVRDLYGKVALQYPAEPMIAFVNDQTEMELRRKGTGEVIYKQTFRIDEESHQVPLFYFDGQWKDKPDYPDATGTDYLANFYFDIPADSAAADVYITVIEYWFDWNDLNNPQKILKYHDFLVAKDVKRGWSSFVKLSKIPDLPKIRPESEFWPAASIKRTGTNDYYVNKDINSSGFNLQIPQGWESQGLVQSLYISFTDLGNLVYEDIVPIYLK